MPPGVVKHRQSARTGHQKNGVHNPKKHAIDWWKDRHENPKSGRVPQVDSRVRGSTHPFVVAPGPADLGGWQGRHRLEVDTFEVIRNGGIVSTTTEEAANGCA